MTTAAERLATFAHVLNPDSTVPAIQVSGSVQGATHTHVWNETPSGTVDGLNAVFTLAGAPSPTASLSLFRNGLLQQVGASNDFLLSGSTVTFVLGNFPQPNSVLIASYTT